MNRPNERAPRARRDVPTVRGMFALVIAFPFALSLVWHYRFDVLAWALSAPPASFHWLSHAGAFLAGAALVVLLSGVADRYVRRNVERSS